MASIRVRVDPPEANRPLHGLMDVADVVIDTAPHWRTGVEYDTINCHDAKIWGQWCTGTGLPIAVPVTRTIVVTLTGTGDDGGPYGLDASATVDGGPERTIRVTVHDVNDRWDAYLQTTDTPVSVVTDQDEPIVGAAQITDVLTGVSISVEVRQEEDGTLTAPEEPIVIAVPEPGIPDGCDQVSVAFAATANTDNENLADVAATATTTASDPRQLSVYVAGRRVVIETDAAEQPVVTGIATGLHRIAVRDNQTWSYVSGWIYIAPDGTGSATLIASTCPTKEINSAPWQTLDADPFTIFAEVTCKTMAFPDAADAVQAALEMSQQRTIERYYWETLTNRSQDLTGDVAVPVVRGLAELEQYIASVYNGMGIIHVSPYGAAYLARNHLIRREAQASDQTLRTWRGTPVVIGHGYPREGSASAVEDDQFWMFITGFITIRQSQAEIFEALDKTTNDLWAIGERTFAIIDDCPVPAKVLVSEAVSAA